MIDNLQDAKDFEDLKTLLDECQSLNTGNHVLQRIEKIIELAERITRRGLLSGKPYTFYEKLGVDFRSWGKREMETRKQEKL